MRKWSQVFAIDFIQRTTLKSFLRILPRFIERLRKSGFSNIAEGYFLFLMTLPGFWLMSIELIR